VEGGDGIRVSPLSGWVANWSSSMPLGVKCVWFVGLTFWAGMCHSLFAARPARAGSPSQTAVRYAESRVVEWHSWSTSLIRPSGKSFKS